MRTTTSSLRLRARLLPLLLSVPVCSIGMPAALLAQTARADSAQGGSTGGDSGQGTTQSGTTQGSGGIGPGGSGSESQPGRASGGAGMGPPPAAASTPAHPMVLGFAARVINGVAYAPSYAPVQVQRAIWAGDRIRLKPYIWGGGHASFASAGYDCSGSVSYVLHAAGLLHSPFDSSDFMSWGHSGLGRWITVYTNPAHAFVEIAGIRLDTSAEADPHPARGTGPRWRPLYPDPPGFDARHPSGL